MIGSSGFSSASSTGFLSITSSHLINMSDSPFHMKDLEDNTLVLPKGTEIEANAPAEGATFVEIGSIQTDPKISALRTNRH